MLRLHGFAASNYHNVVKLALLEKGLDFEEVREYPPATREFREKSPRGKFPCLETEQGFLSESMVILDYLEDRGEGVPLLPGNVFERARVRQFCKMNELYVELVARRLLPKLLFDAEVSPETIDQTRVDLGFGVSAIRRLVTLDPFAIGETFTQADVSAICHWPVVRLVGTKILEENPFAKVPAFEDYLNAMDERPHVQRIRADAGADSARFRERVKEGLRRVGRD